MEAIREHKHLESLFLGQNSICSEGAFAIADELLHNSKLVELHVEDNLVSIVGINSIF
jgi:Ran GTPase-activating protein (RanGAP) involved in mRNA processing and transport